MVCVTDSDVLLRRASIPKMSGKMSRWIVVAAVLLWLAQVAASEQHPAAELPLVCVVIRTYYAHGTYGDSSLINLLRSLKQQTHPR